MAYNRARILENNSTAIRMATMHASTGKSLMAVTLAVAVHAGIALPGGLTPVRAVPSAFLDWETSRDTIESRVALLLADLATGPLERTHHA